MMRTQSLMMVVCLGLACTAYAARSTPQGLDVAQKATGGISTLSIGSTSSLGSAHDLNTRRLHGYETTALPGKPSRTGLNYGRQTVYHNDDAGHKGWCGKELKTEDDAVPVAIDSSYIPMESISPYNDNCGKCMCVRIVSNDKTSNPTPPAGAEQYYGKSFKGRVMDVCPECEKNHIDIYAGNPYIPNTVSLEMAYAVGVWVAEWQFVSCDTNCGNYFNE